MSSTMVMKINSFVPVHSCMHDATALVEQPCTNTVYKLNLDAYDALVLITSDLLNY